MSEWRAHIREEWPQNRVRLLVAQERGADVDMLMQDGTWMTVLAGTAQDEAGLVIPCDAEGEVRVLREWAGP